MVPWFMVPREETLAVRVRSGKVKEGEALRNTKI